MQYYYSLDGTSQQGPTDAAALRAAGVGPTTMVWCEGMPDWQPAGSVAELTAYFPPTPPLPPGPMPQRPVDLPYRHAPVTHDTGTNGMAIASLVCGIVGLTGFCCCIPFIVSILAVVFGYIARGQIKRGYGSGDGIALAGIVLGFGGIALALIGLSLSVTGHGMNIKGMNNMPRLMRP